LWAIEYVFDPTTTRTKAVDDALLVRNVTSNVTAVWVVALVGDTVGEVRSAGPWPASAGATEATRSRAATARAKAVDRPSALAYAPT
jgi:hypothetical protein